MYSRRKVRLIFFPCCTVLLLFLGGCGAEGLRPNTDICNIVVESGEHFSVFGYAQQVERGADVSFTVKLTGNNLIESVDYPNYSITNQEIASIDGVNYQTLTLYNVRYSTAVSIMTYQPYSIRYYANTGEGADSVADISSSLSHLRLNTALGGGLFNRSGYTQTGWNTRPDGTGLSVGQGSRIDPVEGETLELYAQWSRWTPAEQFSYIVQYGGAVVTAWSGESQTLSVPAELNDHPVKAIEAGAFAGVNCEVLVLPAGLERIAPGAFSGAEIREIWFYDDLLEVCDASFEGCPIETVHINAACPPVYSGTYFDTFPDKMDHLRSLNGQKKIVLFAGSSVRFGFDSKQIDEAFSEYAVANMGVYAYTNALPQYDLLLRYMEEGDILLSTPEFDTINTQFCTDNRIGYEFFAMIESDYDLLSQLDCRQYTGVWDAFQQYQAARQGMPGKDYAVSAANYDENGDPVTGMLTYNVYGDYVYPRPNQSEDVAIGIKLADYAPASYPAETLESLNRVYQDFLNKGVTVFFSYSPRNVQAITEASTAQARIELDALLRENLCVPVISPIEESIYQGYYFYETDNHLSNEGVQIRTGRTIEDLRKALAKLTEKS